MGKVTSTWTYGEVACSAWGEFCSFSKGNMRRYARDDARGGVFVIENTQDIELKVALDRV
ncbi:Hypothetical protein CpE19_1698 [Corynebacterium pseudotuberculosis]|nr:Hypothetical protein CpE19_1698 [Corynebacterium pseudotuberculosis]